MITLEEALARLSWGPDREALETYVRREWVRPADRDAWGFEEIDLARAELVHHLREEMRLGDDAVDVLLSLLDQVYGLREALRRVQGALAGQPEPVRSAIIAVLESAD